MHFLLFRAKMRNQTTYSGRAEPKSLNRAHAVATFMPDS